MHNSHTCWTLNYYSLCYIAHALLLCYSATQKYIQEMKKLRFSQDLNLDLPNPGWMLLPQRATIWQWLFNSIWLLIVPVVPL